MNTIEVKAVLDNGEEITINFAGTEQEFKDRISFDEGTFFLQDTLGYFVLVKTITRFKFAAIETTEGNG